MPSNDAEIVKIVAEMGDKFHGVVTDATEKIHGRINDIGKEVGELKTEVKLIRRDLPEQPCQELKNVERTMMDHLEEYENTKGTARNIAASIIDWFMRIAAVVGAAYLVAQWGLR